MNRDDPNNRSYATSRLPLLREGIDPVGNRDLLLKMYDQAAQTWRELISVRFKLFALVPTVSLLLLTTVLSTEGLGKGLSLQLKLFISVLGLAVTMGLLVYELRNSALHDDLISRARKIEDALGVDTGLFRGRLKGSALIRHGTAMALIYGASLAAWLGAVWLLWVAA